MDNSKMNQSELTYSCGASVAKVNLYTGRLLLEHQDVVIGKNSYEISLSHVYNSHMTLPVNSYIGDKWKLNVQQYVYKNNDDYIYVDSSGVNHYFKVYDINKYYDASGNGLILNVNNNLCIICDESDNKLYFENGILLKSVSGLNEAIIQKFIYLDGKLTEIYDERKPNNKLILSYDNNKLSSILVKNGKVTNLQIEYKYENKLLVGINYIKDNLIIDEIRYDYKLLKLVNAYSLNNKSLLGFEYLSEKITSVKTCNITLSDTTKNDITDIYVNDNIYTGTKNYLGEKSKNINRSIANVYVKKINTIEYQKNLMNNNIYRTIVTNETNVKVVYYFNAKGFSVGILEANNGNLNDLRTMEKDPGRSMIGIGLDEEGINRRNSYKLSTADVISTNNIMEDYLENIDTYYGNKCNKFKNFKITFWLKLLDNLTLSKVKVIIKETANSEKCVTNEVTIDRTAINSWQYITIPVNIQYEKIGYVEITFNENDPEKFFKISDMRICYDSLVKLYLSNDNGLLEQLQDVIKIKYISKEADNSINEIEITENSYLTQKDLQLLYLNRFKAIGNNNNNDKVYLMPLNDCTKMIPVKQVTLCTKSNEYVMNFRSDEYGNETSVRFFYEIKSPDENMISNSFLHFISNMKIYGKNYNCLCQINEVTKYDEDDSDYKKSCTFTYYDLFGNLLMEQDEYNVQCIYVYDEIGNINKKIIKNKENNEEIVYSVKTTDKETTFENSSGVYVYNHNNIFGQTESVNYKGNDEGKSSELTIDYTYSKISNNLQKIENNNGGRNSIKYSNSRKVVEVTPLDFNDKNYYSFRFTYDSFGCLNKIFYKYSIGNSVYKENLLIEKSIDRLNGVIETTKIRSENAQDTEVIELDKYGRINTIKTNEKETKIVRQALWESSSASEVLEMYDPFEEVTHYFEYDDFNNIKHYYAKKGENSYINIEKESNTKKIYQYTNPSWVFKHITDIKYDNSVLINPRVDYSLDLEDIRQHDDYMIGETDYEYDHLGRMKNKTHYIDDGVVDSADTTIKVSSNYKYGTDLKTQLKYELNNAIASDHSFIYDYSYNSRGLLKTQKLKIDNSNVDSSDITYTYDKANRLINERNNVTNSQIIYNYKSNGSLDYIEDSSKKNLFEYSAGRLIKIAEQYKTENLNNKEYSFEYDNFGNCIKGLNSEYEWTRGNLLSKWSDNSRQLNFYYNNSNNRFKKEIVNEKSITYVYDGNKLLGEVHSDGKYLEYIYDIEGIRGFAYYKTGAYQGGFYYIKDHFGNVVSIVNKDKEVGRYEYDTWGNCKIVKDIDNIASINPIRWKSQYYDCETNFYYINGYYYSPIMKQYLSMVEIETIASKPNQINGLYLYNVFLDNVVNLVYNENTLFGDYDIQYDPQQLSGWDRFWQTKFGKALSLVLFFAALIITFILSLVSQNWWILGLFLIEITAVSIIGCTIAGFQSMNNGDSFVRGVENYINSEMSQAIAIESIITIITCSIQLIATYIKKIRARIPTIDYDDLPENAKKAYDGYESNDWRGQYKGQDRSMNAGKKYKNMPSKESKLLPTDKTYKEFDINPPGPKGRDAYRFVTSNDKIVYYTNDHYKSFFRVIKK